MDEALAAACGDELEHPVAITFACCQLFAACGRVRDYEHAFQWCQRVADLCERRNIWSVLSATRCSYAAILIARGRFAEAERLLVAAESRYGEKGLPRHRALVRSRGSPIFASGRAGSTRRTGCSSALHRIRCGTSPRLPIALAQGHGERRHRACRARICASATPRRSSCGRLRSRSSSARRSSAGAPSEAARGARRAARDLAVKVGRAAVVGPSLVARAAVDEAPRRPRVRAPPPSPTPSSSSSAARRPTRPR